MASPDRELLTALFAWLADDARERVSRTRGDTGADTEAAVMARHAALRGPRIRERFEGARERGVLPDAEIASIAAWLHDAHLAVARASAHARIAEALASRVPHDSDHHTPIALFSRMVIEPHERRRRAFARSIEAFAPSLGRAIADGLAEVEEIAETASWLRAIPPPSDRAGDLSEVATTILRTTEDAFSEALARAAHGASVELELWPDLFFVLRATRLDSLAAPRARWRRLADRFAALGVRDALMKRAHVELGGGTRLRTEVIALAVPNDVRILPATLELGLASERADTIALGRAVAIAWTHPALPPILALPDEGSVGRALGALLAHVAVDPRASELDPASARALSEHALALELFELRTEAAIAIARRSIGARDFADAAREALRGAWQVDVDADLAACVCMFPRRHPLAALRTLRWAAPMHVALRERYDEDWWKNPRAAEPLRAACERGTTLTVEAWAEELGAVADTGARYRELLG